MICLRLVQPPLLLKSWISKCCGYIKRDQYLLSNDPQDATGGGCFYLVNMLITNFIHVCWNFFDLLLSQKSIIGGIKQWAHARRIFKFIVEYKKWMCTPKNEIKGIKRSGELNQISEESKISIQIKDYQKLGFCWRNLIIPKFKVFNRIFI